MYITIKTGHQQVNQERTNAIDELFAGNTDIILPDANSDRTIVRTRTYHQEHIHTSNHVHPEMMAVVNERLKELRAKHPHPETEYETFRIPKKTHGFREINAPLPELKKDLKHIANLLTGYLGILSHDSAWAYVPGRDVVYAMKEHTKNKSRWYLKLDLHDFFGSCSKEFIIKQLKKIYPFAELTTHTDEILNNIAELATKDNGLPQGTPLSPVLTNLIMVEYDYKINNILKHMSGREIEAQRYIYTRYADDIIISAKNKFDYNKIVTAIKGLFNDAPLTINEEKTRFGSSSGRNWNLGIMCNKDNEITIGYRRKQHMKVIISNYMKDKEQDRLWSLEDLYWLQGQLSWLQNVEPTYFRGFRTYINNKYDNDIVNSVIADIKSYTN